MRLCKDRIVILIQNFITIAPLVSTRQTLLSPEGQRILTGMPPPATFSGSIAFARAVYERFAFVDA
ncbi:MAG: hypothetical protein OXC62_01950 [Aestuariivita sp.]|nr:hypothetical protein [Aestuariivita sp.]